MKGVATLSQLSLLEKIAVAPAPRAVCKRYRERFRYFVMNTNYSQESIEEVDMTFVRYYDTRFAERKPHPPVETAFAARMDSFPASSKK